MQQTPRSPQMLATDGVIDTASSRVACPRLKRNLDIPPPPREKKKEKKLCAKVEIFFGPQQAAAIRWAVLRCRAGLLFPENSLRR